MTRLLGLSLTEPMLERLGEVVEVIIPPSRNAVARPQSALNPTVRDNHIAEVEARGHMAWQKSTGYTQMTDHRSSDG